MKKFILAMSAIIGFSVIVFALPVNECKTDIYFGNGVWNTEKSGDISRQELGNIIKDEIIKGDPLLQTKYGKVKLSYNWGQGRLLDVLETYYQLREAGQLNGIGFFSAIAILTAYQPELTLGAIATQKLLEPYTKDWEQGNVDEMWQKYYYKSFKLGHRVLLVSHSQGNLFANRVFDTINPTEYKRYFANLQVASPASRVKADEVGKGAYVTLFGDPIINPIPGSMPGNAHGSPGHAFVAAYLDQEDPYNKIVSKIKALLPTLDVEISQWKRDGEFINKNTCEERMKVKHRFDQSVDMPFDVYMFAPKKLYQVNEEWVMASCGGKNILGKDHEMPTWDGKKDNECYMIDNPQKEKIVKRKNYNHIHRITSFLTRIVATEDTGYQTKWYTFGSASMEITPGDDYEYNLCGNKIYGFTIRDRIDGRDPNHPLMHDLYARAIEKSMEILKKSEENCSLKNIVKVKYRIEKDRDGCNILDCAVISWIYQDIYIGVD